VRAHAHACRRNFEDGKGCSRGITGHPRGPFYTVIKLSALCGRPYRLRSIGPCLLALLAILMDANTNRTSANRPSRERAILK